MHSDLHSVRPRVLEHTGNDNNKIALYASLLAQRASLDGSLHTATIRVHDSPLYTPTVPRSPCGSRAVFFAFSHFRWRRLGARPAQPRAALTLCHASHRPQRKLLVDSDRDSEFSRLCASSRTPRAAWEHACTLVLVARFAHRKCVASPTVKGQSAAQAESVVLQRAPNQSCRKGS